MGKLNAALILDDLSACKWEISALEEASSMLNTKVVLNCINTNIKKRYVKHFLYYILNIFTLKNRLTKRVNYANSRARIIDFECGYDGLWQIIPDFVLKNLEDENIDVVIKYGMNLIRIEGRIANYDVLSFHHGDPSKYRGRPAGFYELLNGDAKSGIVIQKLTNKLDSGGVLAFAESKVVQHSYKKTALNFYASSKYLLRKALLNLENGKFIEMNRSGKNYTLPSNYIVAYFLSVLSVRLFSRFLYGAFYEKNWRVAVAENSISLDKDNLLRRSKFSNYEVDPKYNFCADPFFSTDFSKVRLEALDRKTGLGDIVEIFNGNTKEANIILSGEHYSYPFSFDFDGTEYLMPEVASHSDQYIFPLGGSNERKIYLKGLEGRRIVDATLLQHNHRWYLFFGDNNDAHSVLHLWSSVSLVGDFTVHPESPICMSPTSARMAGRIFQSEQGLYRLGQNNERGYGASVSISKITSLSSDFYEEEVSGTVAIDNAYGPHSIDFNQKKNQVLLDYYKNRFSLFSGLRRIKAKLSKK